MDQRTLSYFGAGKGVPCSNQNLKMLTDEEYRLYQYLRDNNLRLEQEKITQSYAENQLFSIVNHEECIVSS